MAAFPAPDPGTIERWAFELVRATTWPTKARPAAPPDPADGASWEPAPRPRRIESPGRPPQLRVVERAPKAPSRGALKEPRARARLFHTFLHHEVQAAELFGWAVLAFPDTPRAFRRELVRLAREELGHLALYQEHLEHLGASVGDWPVRDWIWQRGTTARSPTELLAFVGLGLEGGNLDHTRRFATGFRDAGDERGAAILERVERDEVGHVAFAVHWFRHFAGALDYERFARALPEPLSPAVFRGEPLNRDARRRAGLDDAFLDALEREGPTTARRR